MTTLYIESSSALAWILGEPSADQILSLFEKAEAITASILTLLETKRNLIRLEKESKLRSAERQKLVGLFDQYSSEWFLLELTPEIQSRTIEPFPIEPVRTADAIHLATILHFARSHENLVVLSLDKKIIANLEPLGLAWALKT